MEKFVELWIYLSATPLFGLTATVVTYVLAHAVYERVNQAPWGNPVLWTVLALVAILSISSTPPHRAGSDSRGVSNVWLSSVGSFEQQDKNHIKETPTC